MNILVQEELILIYKVRDISLIFEISVLNLRNISLLKEICIYLFFCFIFYNCLASQTSLAFYLRINVICLYTSNCCFDSHKLTKVLFKLFYMYICTLFISVCCRKLYDIDTFFLPVLRKWQSLAMLKQLDMWF